MLIVRVEIENIKSHKNSVYEFKEGTIAIIGENGIGKTTIIESIGWVLFDYLNYNQKDFIRLGERKGVVRVTFISGYDGQEYTVERDTDGSYLIYDAGQTVTVASGKSEVLARLAEHLGIERGIDVRRLFECAVGVPQGTFTSDFLASPSKRKDTFNKLLRVEEYERASSRLLEAERYVKERINEKREQISRIEGKLHRLEDIRRKKEEIRSRMERTQEELDSLISEIKRKEESVRKLDEKKEHIEQIRREVGSLEERKKKDTELLKIKREELKRAEYAKQKVEQHESDYKNYKAIERQIEELRVKLSECNHLKKKEYELRVKISEKESEKNVVKAALEEIEQKERQKEEMKSRVFVQESLERKKDDLLRRLARKEVLEEKKRRLEEEKRGLEEKRKVLRSKHAEISKEMKELKERITEVDSKQGLESRYDEVVREITKLQVKVELNKKFKEEIKNGLCPIVSQKCLNLTNNQTLDGFVKFNSEAVEDRIEELQKEKQEIEFRIRLADEVARKKSILEELELKLSEEVEKLGIELSCQIEKLESEIVEIRSFQEELKKVEIELYRLGNPKAKLELLEKELARRKRPGLEQKISELGKDLESYKYELEKTMERLKEYQNIDAKMEELNNERRKCEHGYQEFIANKELSENLGKIQEDLQRLEQDLEDTGKKISNLTEVLKQLESDYDADSHRREEENLRALRNRSIQKETELREAENRKEEIETELRELEKEQSTLQEYRVRLEQLELTHETIKFTRESLKQAGPIIASKLRLSVSEGASRIFREIIGNAELTLHWSEDYGIEIEEKGYMRPFSNLSGGEQMAAAISLRLALLYRFSEIRFAFFDEPTAHMDEERREKLAEQIAIARRTKGFNQLFVISHDDTFEGKVDNVIRVER